MKDIIDINKLIDIHTHILPDIDGGAETLEEAKAMVKSSYESGVRTIVATPHLGGYMSKSRPDNFEMRDREYMRKRTEAIQSALTILWENCLDHPGLRIVSGSEIFCSADSAGRIIELLGDDLAFTINGTEYVLIEFSYSVSFDEILKVIQMFNEAGYRPVLAHVENYQCLYGHEERISRLIDAGTVIQMNADHLDDPFCMGLIEKDLVHLLGSDCHDNNDRRPNLAEGIALVEQKIGSAKAEELQNNAIRILNGKII